MAHYKRKVMKNVFSLLSSTNALGNLNLLSHDIGTGVKDFFYKPIEGFVDGPIEGGRGLVIGTASLFGNTAKGAFGTVSRITGAISNCFLLLAGDDDYINKREQESERPSNVLQGLVYGFKGAAGGIKSGITGIVEQPIKGAKA
jgi:hypothetical protein